MGYKHITTLLNQNTAEVDTQTLLLDSTEEGTRANLFDACILGTHLIESIDATHRCMMVLTNSHSSCENEEQIPYIEQRINN